MNNIEVELLGNVQGMKILHLQCHFGQDSISLSRMGAEVTGVDFSDKAINYAKDLALQTGSNATFVCSDIYDLPNNLLGQYDIVFTSYGTIGWLPDIEKWANVVSHFLRPDGKFVFVEFHPVVWMFDDNYDKIAYHYLNEKPIIETENGTYADRNAEIQNKYICWNHGIGSVINSLIKSGLNIESLIEYDYSPYNCFNGMIAYESNKFRIEKMGNKIPLVYSIVAKNS